MTGRALGGVTKAQILFFGNYRSGNIRLVLRVALSGQDARASLAAGQPLADPDNRSAVAGTTQESMFDRATCPSLASDTP